MLSDQLNNTNFELDYHLPRSIPVPSHRHGASCGPWPWMDLSSEETNHLPRISPCCHEDCVICPQWLGYPQSHFPNWTPDQVQRSKIGTTINRQHDCRFYIIDVTDNSGKFAPADRHGILVTKVNGREIWHGLQRKVSHEVTGPLPVRFTLIEYLVKTT
jgi:hypothetical protein